jgi:hypothetical protein
MGIFRKLLGRQNEQEYFIERCLNRASLNWAITPQAYRAELLGVFYSPDYEPDAEIIMKLKSVSFDELPERIQMCLTVVQRLIEAIGPSSVSFEKRYGIAEEVSERIACGWPVLDQFGFGSEVRKEFFSPTYQEKPYKGKQI